MCRLRPGRETVVHVVKVSLRFAENLPLLCSPGTAWMVFGSPETLLTLCAFSEITDRQNMD